MGSISPSKQKSVKTKRRPSKKKYLEKYERLEASPSPQDPLKVLLNVWKQLWKHQKNAASFSLKQEKTFLAMEIGTGKTLTTLASLAKRHVKGSVNHVLVVCPASAIHVWKTEIKKWLKGTTLSFSIVSYDFARFYFKYLRKDAPEAIVMDEAHRLKNPNSAQSRRVAKIAANIPLRYGLTGTPVADKVIDLFAQYRAVDPSLLGEKWTDFRRDYLYQHGFKNKELGITKENKKLVLDLVAPITYQVLKTEAMKHLKLAPPSYLYTQLKGTQKKLYQDLERDLVARHDEFTVTADRTITKMLRLQQITGGHVPDDDENLLTFECGKADLFLELMRDWPRDKKLVIFARFIHELQLIEDICKRTKFSSYIYTPKTAYIDDDFQSKKHPQVSISQIQRGGVSRTLTRSSTPVFFSKTFSYVDYDQAVGRVYRGGQTELVTPIFLCTRDTIDEDVDISVLEKESEAKFFKRFLRSLRNRVEN